MNTKPSNPSTTALPAREESFDFWRTAQRALRGRHRLALTLALVGGVAGAGLGAMLGQRLFTATGLVRIASVLPQVLRETDQNRPMANFDGFIQAQREVMTSRETIQAAMQDDAWLRAGTPGGPPSEARFASALKVETRHRSDNLRVTFTDPDADVAATAVGTIIAAYRAAFERDQDRVDGQRMDQLTSRRDTLSAQVQELEGQIADVADGRTGPELEPLYLAAAERLKKLRAALVDVQCAIAGGPDLTHSRAPASRLPTAIVADELLRSSAAAQARIESQLADARAGGCGPNHPLILGLEAAAEESRQRVERAIAMSDDVRAAGSEESPASLSEREASLRTFAQSAEDEMKRLAEQRAQLETLEERAAMLRASLRETDSRLDALNTEASLGSRLTVITGGDKPMTARRDNRAKTTALGAMTGAALPLAAMIAGTTLRRRYRLCADVADDLMDRVPFIAVVPDLDAAPNLSAAAAHSVHSMRVRLQPPAPAESRVYLFTSASPGEGKSGLALALGLSFAAAGFRTLLVDGDTGSRGLTGAFDADDSPGTIEAAAGEEPSIRRINAGLSVMTAGQCAARDTYRFAPAASMRLIASLRERFDVVLIDADPVLTGITASVFAPQADGVVLSLGRGQQQSLVLRSLGHLEMLGATLAAGVFNRAAAGEFREATKEPSETTGTAAQDLPERLQRFGPLVAATLSSLSLTRADDLDLLPAPTAMTLTRPDSDLRAVA